jgi:hypothetical protein
MTEDEINKQVSKETSSMSSVSVGIDLDNQALRGLQDTVKAINKEAKEMAINFKEALEALKEMGKDYGLTQVISYTENSPGGTGGGGGGAQRGAAGTTIVGGRAHDTKPVTPAVDSVAAALGGFKAFQAGAGSAPQFAPGGSIDGRKLTTGGTGAIGLAEKFQAGGFTTAGNFASMAGTLAKVGVQAIDKRVEDARPYVLAADKSTLQMQQITGMSQRGVMDNLRMPLTDYKLGTNGINQLMSLQARTGINASQQASSVEFMRTLSGFSMGAEGASSIIESLAAPETVNKMFMMTGMSLIGPGGKQKSTQSLIQGLAKRAGLDNKNIAESAIAPGSVTRATLSAMGVSGDLQDQVIQYGQANNNFREKGGKGSYDPTKEADRKRMGIDDTYAMEAEETERKRGKRDEKFYQDQAGSYAKLERQTQRLTDAMAKLEEVMAPIISARTGSRIAQKVLGGVGSMLSNIPIVGGLLGSIGGILGDPRPSNSRYIGENDINDIYAPTTTIPSNSGGGGTIPTTTIPNSSPVTGLSWPSTIGGFSGIHPDTGLPPREHFIHSLGITNHLGPEETLILGGGAGSTPLDGGPEHFNIPGFDTPENFAIMGNKTTAPGTGLNGSLNSAIRRLANRAYAETNGNVQIKIASGRRSAEEQKALWTQRMQVVPNGYKLPYYKDDFDGKNYNLVRYNGQLWMKKPGNSDPPIAAPGTSLHELGLAADLDLSDPRAALYVAQNLWRFGLSSGKADGEPGHIQLSWTKDMSVSQFLGSTAMSYDEAFFKGSGTDDESGFRDTSPNMFNASTLAEFGGVNLNQFNRSFLTRLGTTITLNKLKVLTAISHKEGTGGNYNPWNIVSNNDRKVTINGRIFDRSETNFNRNAEENRWPVQNFDNFKEGVDSALYHYLKSNEGLMQVLMEENPSMERLKAVLSTSSNYRKKLKALNDTTEPQWEKAILDKNYQGIANSYGKEGLDAVIPIEDWGKKMGAWGGSVGDPVSGSSMQPMSIPNSPMLSSSGSSGGGSNYHEGSTVTISPVINMTSTGNNGAVSEYDLRSMAKKIAKLIEQESNITKFRSM